MAEPKKASLTVLGGPMAGTRFLLPDGPARLLIGSDDSCHFQLALPEVAAVHARLSVDVSGAVTIHDEGSGLYLNDNAVGEATPLRNGDIVWLGTPGDEEVVMLQCVLPPRTVAARPAEAPSVPEVRETTAIAPGEFNLADEAQAGIAEGWTEDPSAPSPSGEYAAFDEGGHGVDELSAPGEAPAPLPPYDTEIYVEEGSEPAPVPEPFGEYDETAAESAPEPARGLVPEPSEPSLFVPPEEPAVDAAELEPSEYVIEDSAGATDATVIMGETVAEPSYYTEDGGGPDETLLLSQAERVAPPAREAAPPPPAVSPAPISPPAPSPTASERPVRPATPAPTPPPRRRDTQTLPKVTEPPPARTAAARPAPPASSSPVGLYAAIGLGAIVVLGGAFAAWRFLAAPRPAATPAPISEAELARAVPPTPAPAATPAAEPTPEPMEAASIPPPLPSAAAATPAPAPTPVAPTPRPTPSPVAATPTPKATPRPAPPATPPPSAEQVRAQQVAGLLGQADAALGGGQYDAAVGHLDEALRIDPQNARAAADRARAVTLRDAARRKFVPGRTIVKTEKAAGALVGFEGADVKTPDVSGRIEFEMSPSSGLRPGDPYSLKFYLVNDGRKTIKIGGITATTIVNGTGSGAGVAPSVKAVDPKERALLGEISGVWKDGTTSWSAEVVVTANKADSLKSTLAWR